MSFGTHEYAWRPCAGDPDMHENYCTVCGLGGFTGTHAYAARSDASAHWQVCKLCGYSTAKTAHSFAALTETAGDCLTDGVKTGECSVCGYTLTETVPSPGHHFGLWTGDAARTHSAQCERCETIKSQPCQFILDGETEICAVCGDVYENGEYVRTLERVENAELRPAEEGVLPKHFDLVVFALDDKYVVSLEYFGEIIEPNGEITVVIPETTEFPVTGSGVY